MQTNYRKRHMDQLLAQQHEELAPLISLKLEEKNW